MKDYKAKTIDFAKGEFEAMGKKYFILSSISLDRMIAYYKHAPEFTYGLDWKKIYDNNELKMKYINEHKQGEAYSLCKLENEYIANFKHEQTKYDACLRLASIFIVREDEDPAIYDYQFQEQKFADWRKEGLEYSSFFSLVANTLPNYLKVYKQSLASISAAIQKAPFAASGSIEPK